MDWDEFCEKARYQSKVEGITYLELEHYLSYAQRLVTVSYTHLTLPTKLEV